MLIKQGKTNIKYLLIVLVLAAVVGGGALWCITKKESPFTQLSEMIKPEIQTLEIIPSQESEDGIVYQEGAKAIATGKNLAKVEFRQRGGGQIYTSPEGGLIGIGTKTATQDNEEKWESPPLPTEKLLREFCAIGFDIKGNKVGEVCLFNVYGQVDETADWKTYRNEEYGFEIEYPTDWKNPLEVGMNIYFENEDVQIRTAGARTLSSVRTFEGEASRREELIKGWPEVLGFKKENILLNEIPAIKLSYIDTKQNLIKNIVFLKKEDSTTEKEIICEIETTIFNQNETYVPLVSQMFSTFRFLE